MQKLLFGIVLVLFGFGTMQAHAAEPCIPLIMPEEAFPEPIAQLELSELLPNPTEGEEYIELRIVKGGAIADWSIRDASGKTVSLGEAEEVGGYLLFWQSNSKIYLNNSGDTIELIDPEGNVIEKTSYENIGEDIAWSKIEDVWMESASTPGEPNETVDELTNTQEEAEEPAQEEESKPEIHATTIADAKSAAKGTEVILQGVMTSPFGATGSRSAYIQDDTGGIQLYISRGELPEIEEGTIVTVEGKTSTYLDEPRVLVAADTILTDGNELLEPEPVNVISEELVGSFIVTQGTIEEKSSQEVVLDSSIVVYRKSTSEISFSELEVGQTVAIAGIVSQTRDEIRLLPRFQADIKIQVPVASGTSLISAANAASGSSSQADEVVIEQQKRLAWYIVGAILALSYLVYRNKDRITQGIQPLLKRINLVRKTKNPL